MLLLKLTTLIKLDDVLLVIDIVGAHEAAPASIAFTMSCVMYEFPTIR
ncbi:MAG: hypothetical protein FWG83_05605 [Oscillospiraceae bacterium]|nr:hypothetical protein [Oscillospiraceae bacterium]